MHAAKEAGSHRLGDSQPQILTSREREIIIYPPTHFRQRVFCEEKEKKEGTRSRTLKDNFYTASISAHGMITFVNPGLLPLFRVTSFKSIILAPLFTICATPDHLLHVLLCISGSFYFISRV